MDTTINGITLKKPHARRLRALYRSAGWPCLDMLEIELLAAGLLERVQHAQEPERVRVTDAGIRYLAEAAQGNRAALAAHNGLVARIAHGLQREGRLVWTGLALRARLAPGEDGTPGAWRNCLPDVFSIRNSSVQAYLEPVVHEIKVSRADLLGDLRRPEKRQAYLDLGGQCWYVLGRDARGRPIAEPEEIPPECGVLQLGGEALQTLRMAPKRACPALPFGVWMALARATPLAAPDEDAPGL